MVRVVVAVFCIATFLVVRGEVNEPNVGGPLAMTSSIPPADTMNAFYQLWEQRECTKMVDLLTADFRFYVSDFRHYNASVRLVYTVANMSGLCNESGGQFALKRVQGRNSGSTGIGQWFGVNYFGTPKGASAPCTVPYLVDVMGVVDSAGRIQRLEEFIDLAQYQSYFELCPNTTQRHAPSRFPVDPSVTVAKPRGPPSRADMQALPLVDLGKKLVFLYMSGQCDALLPFLAPNATFVDGFGGEATNIPTFIAGCKQVHAELGEKLVLTTFMTDGPLVTLSGHQAVTVLDPTTNAPCSVLAQESIAWQFDESRQVVHGASTYDSAMWETLKTKCHFKSPIMSV